MSERPTIKRCAVYTRKSVEDGLEQEFNSLDAQRESAENYIASQRANGWICLPERYDDGGFSGGNMERPALKRLLEDADAGLIDIIIVYKIDRLSRSLADFADLSARLDAAGVSFVSVTQEINTSTSSGRMMLNILMTFAQYEREIIGERIRDKIALAKKRGKHTGGFPSLGYDSIRDETGSRLKINKKEAEIVRRIFDRYIVCGSAREVALTLQAEGVTHKQRTSRRGKQYGGTPLDTPAIYRILRNPIYIGKVKHKEKVYDGEHDAIIGMDKWEAAQKLLTENHVARGTKQRAPNFTALRGLIKCGDCGSAMGLSHTKKSNRKYAYYVCVADNHRAVRTCGVDRIPADEIERVVLHQLGAIFNTTTCVAMVHRAYKVLKGKVGTELTMQEIRQAFTSLELIWDALFPVERYKLMHFLLENIMVYSDRIELEIKTAGLGAFVNDLMIMQNRGK